MGGFLFGVDASVISGVIKFIKPEFHISELELGWLVSSPSLSAMFAMLIAGRVSDRVGRKKVLSIIAFLFATSALFSAIAPSLQLLVLARMIGGIAFGSALIITPVYIAEISPAASRGRLVSIQQLNIVLGFSFAYFSNYLILQFISDGSLITEANAWRWMLGIELIPAMLYFGLLFIIPQSPRWLYMKGLKDEAKEVLIWLHGQSTAEEEDALIRKSIHENDKKPVLRDLFHKKIRFVVIVAVLLAVFQQITGINVIFFYATSIFEQSGIGADASFAQAILVGIVNIAFTIFAILLIDRLGRKPLLLIGLAGISISMSITSYGFYKAEYTLTSEKLENIEGLNQPRLLEIIGQTYENDVLFKDALKIHMTEEEFFDHEMELITQAINMDAMLILIGILGFVASFAFSIGPVMWVMLSELFPLHIRGLAISVMGFINSLTSWLIQLVFPLETYYFGNATTYIMYAGFAVIGFVIFARILPETKGKSLEEIQSSFTTA